MGMVLASLPGAKSNGAAQNRFFFTEDNEGNKDDSDLT